jgi:hypothetical protein
MRRKDLRLYNERIENLDRNWAVESIDEILNISRVHCRIF